MTTRSEAATGTISGQALILNGNVLGVASLSVGPGSGGLQGPWQQVPRPPATGNRGPEDAAFGYPAAMLGVVLISLSAAAVYTRRRAR